MQTTAAPAAHTTPETSGCTPSTTSAAVHAKFKELQRQLCDSLIERDDEVEALLLGCIAQEHVLFVGEPGTAKSLACELLTKAIGGASIFQVLLSKFSTPEELFGPVSVAGLKHDEYKRLTRGFMPESEVVFVDEIWKASSAILNTMLRLMNERSFVNGPSLVKCPLRLMVAASNEWPQGEELAAAFDRFLIRKVVRPVKSEGNRDRLLFDDLTAVTAKLDLREIDYAAGAASVMPWGDAAKDALREMLRSLRGQGIEPGDRRCRKAVKLAQSSAWLAGSSEVEPEHLECLRWTLWRVPGEQIEKAGEVICKIANPVGAEISGVISEFEEVSAGMPATVDGKFTSGLSKLEDCRKRLEKIAKAGHGGTKAESALKYAKERIIAFRKKAIDGV